MNAARIRANGEVIRLAEHIKNLRGLLEALESCIDGDIPVSGAAQSVADASVRIVTAAGRLDAYTLVARDKEIP